jgi:TM2 domain-containing membrane protein YozV
MTETTGATCPTCTTALPVAGTPCPRCTSAAPGGATGGAAMPQYATYQAPYQGTPAPQGYQPMPYQQAPYQQAPYQQTPFPQAPFQQTPYPGTPYPVAPYQPNPYAVRAPKSAGIAVLLTFLWIGAGHLYLDRMGTGLALMAGHFFIGFFLFFLFFPLGFVAWLAAVVCCAVWCSNLAGQINAGTVPPRETW